MSNLTNAIQTKVKQEQSVLGITGSLDATRFEEFLSELLELVDDADQVSKIVDINSSKKVCFICGKPVPFNRRAVYGEHLFHTHCAARSTVLSKQLIDKLSQALQVIATTDVPEDKTREEHIEATRRYASAALGIPHAIISEDRGE